MAGAEPDHFGLVGGVDDGGGVAAEAAGVDEHEVTIVDGARRIKTQFGLHQEILSATLMSMNSTATFGFDTQALVALTIPRPPHPSLNGMLSAAIRDMTVDVTTEPGRTGTCVSLAFALDDSELLPAPILQLIAKVEKMGGNSTVLVAHGAHVTDQTF